MTLKIELGVKVLTDEERLRNTIAHEACHAATYVISGDYRNQHGATWKSWWVAFSYSNQVPLTWGKGQRRSCAIILIS